MFAAVPIEAASKAEFYRDLASQLTGLIGDEPSRIANAANTAAFIFHSLPDINWAGFYFLRGGDLVLGPFQGKPACIRIPLGRGVCGTAAERRETLLSPTSMPFPATSPATLPHAPNLSFRWSKATP